jgi:hypothetical protein
MFYEQNKSAHTMKTIFYALRIMKIEFPYFMSEYFIFDVEGNLTKAWRSFNSHRNVNQFHSPIITKRETVTNSSCTK